MSEGDRFDAHEAAVEGEVELERLDGLELGTGVDLEKLFGDAQRYVDPDWLERGNEVAARVCQVRIGTQARGTGFLIGPDLVATCHHVVSEVHAGQASAADLEFVFGFSRRGTSTHEGTAVRALPVWAVADSVEKDLDFTLIQLERDVGLGWIDLPQDDRSWSEHRGLTIIQHPVGGPLKFALGSDAKGSILASGARVGYRIPTQKGSSGSPVLSFSDWSLLALHKGAEQTEDLNCGIPFFLIGGIEGVRQLVAASIAKRSTAALATAGGSLRPVDPAIGLLSEGNATQRSKGRLRLRREYESTRLLPPQAVSVIVAQCHDRTLQGDEKRECFELARDVGLSAEIRGAAAEAWFDPDGPEDLIASLAPAFADDLGGFDALCDLVEAEALPVGHRLEGRLERAFACLRDHVRHTEGLSKQRSERALALASPYTASPRLRPIITSLFVYVTGRPPPQAETTESAPENDRSFELETATPKEEPRLPAGRKRRFPVLAAVVLAIVGVAVVVVVVLVVLSYAFAQAARVLEGLVDERLDASTSTAESIYDAGQRGAATSTTSDVEDGWNELPRGDARAPRIRYKRVTSALDLPPHAPTTGTYRIHMVDVGSGLALFVEGPDFTLLYDGGSSDKPAEPDVLISYLSAVAAVRSRGTQCMPSSFIDALLIDHVILSHAHLDHVNYLDEAFRCFRVLRVWDSGLNPGTRDYIAFLEEIAPTLIDYHTVREPAEDRSVHTDKTTIPMVVRWHRFSEGAIVALGEGATMRFLHATASDLSDLNQSSLVVKLELGNASALFMGDASSGSRGQPTDPPAGVEAKLLADHAGDLDVDVLQVGHHGSSTGSRIALIQRMSPLIALISAGPREFGGKRVPDEEVIATMKRFSGLGATPLTTFEHDEGCDEAQPFGSKYAAGCDNWLVEIIVAQ